MNIEEVNQAYSKVIEATDTVQKAGILFAEAKADVAKEVLMATSSGAITGKNDSERKANAFNMFESNFDKRDRLESKYKEASHGLALAQIELNCLRDCIRVLELTKE